MGMLDGAVGYLSGSIEYAKDHGVMWRKKFAQLVEQYDLHIDLIDPTDKPPVNGFEGLGPDERQDLQAQLQRSGQFQELQEIVHDYRRYDLRVTDYSNFLVVVVDPTIPQWGTANEVYLAEQQHKPIFFVNEGGLYTLPRWLFGVIGHVYSKDPNKAHSEANVYTSIEAVVEELARLDKAKLLTDEWVLVRKAIELRRRWKFH